MAVESPPFANQAGTTPAEQMRRAAFALTRRGASIGQPVGGLVVPATDMLCTAVAGRGLEVAPGECIVPGTSTPGSQGGYYGRVTTTDAKTFLENTSGNPRVDRIVAFVEDKAYGGTADKFEIVIVKGTPEASATLGPPVKGAPAAPANSLTLAYALCPNGFTSATIANQEPALYPGLGVALYLEGTFAKIPTAGVKGRIYKTTDTHVVYFDSGSAWELLGTLAAGAAYTRLEAPAASTEYEPSPTRATTVIFNAQQVSTGATGSYSIFVGGVEVAHQSVAASVSENRGVSITFRVPPGGKWHYTSTFTGGGAAFAAYLIE